MLSDAFRPTLHTPGAAFLSASNILPRTWLPGFNASGEVPWHSAYETMIAQSVQRAGGVPNPTLNVLPAAAPVSGASAGAGGPNSAAGNGAQAWQRWIDVYLREHRDAPKQPATIKTWLTPVSAQPTASDVIDRAASSALATTHLQLNPGEEHTLVGMQKMILILQRLHEVLPDKSSESSKVQSAVDKMKAELAFAQSHLDLVAKVFGDTTHSAQATALLAGEPLPDDAGVTKALERALAEEKEAVRVNAAYEALGDALGDLKANLPADSSPYALPDGAMNGLRRLMAETAAKPTLSAMEGQRPRRIVPGRRG